MYNAKNVINTPFTAPTTRTGALASARDN